MKPIGITLLAAALLALTATPGLAQYVVPAKAGTVNFAEGQVQLDGHTLETSITHYPDIKEGSVLSTEDGRAEVLLTPGVILRLGDHASLKMITNRLIDTRVELLGGKAVVEADQTAKDTSVTIVVNNAAVSLPKPGIYRFNFAPAQLKVFKGEAAVLEDSETKLVGAGRTCALGGTEVAVKKFETDDTDALDNWSHRRAELMAMANVSGANALSPYGGLYGSGYMAGMGMPMMGCSGFGYMPAFGYAGAFGFGYTPYGIWGYNPWYDMYTYIPCSGMAYSPYGYTYASPVTVTTTKAPTRGPGVTRGPARGPTHVPVNVAARSSVLALAVNGSHTPGFRGGAGITSGYGSASAGHGGFAGYAGGGSSGSAARAGGFTGGGASAGGGAFAAGAASAGSGAHGGSGGGGGGGAAAGGAGHR
jgi:hypothetical protein